MWKITNNCKQYKSLKILWFLKLFSILRANRLYLFKAHTTIMAANYHFSSVNLSHTHKINNLARSRMLSTFSTFVQLSISTPKNKIYVHPSNKQLYTTVSYNGTNYSSIKLAFNIYRSFYLLIFNVFYHDIKVLSFGNNIFKREITSLNWHYFSQYLNNMKFTPLSIFYKPNKLNDTFPTLFKFFKLNGFYTAIVYDAMMHKNTIYYLQRLNYFSIGIVPANLPKYTLSVAIPSINENSLNHLFLLKLFNTVSQEVKLQLFKSFKKMIN